MPCFTVVLMSIKLEASDRDLLRKAVDAQGWAHTTRDGIIYAVNNRGGVMTIHADHMEVMSTHGWMTDQLKRGYSEQVLRAGADQFGFDLARAGAGLTFTLEREVPELDLESF